MLNTIVWALLTGMVTGGAWVAIVLLRHERGLARLDRVEPEQLDDLHRRVADLEGMGDHVAELEERLAFTERLLTQERDARRLAPPVQ